MANKKFLLGMLAVVLAFGLVLAGCDLAAEDTDSPTVTDSSTVLEGTWNYGSYQFVFAGSSYTFKVNGTESHKGKLSVNTSAKTFTITKTTGGSGTYSYNFTSGTALSITEGQGAVSSFQGAIWTKQ